MAYMNKMYMRSRLVKMGDERETLTKLGSLSRMLRQSELSWNESKDILENLKTWALKEQNR